MKLVTDLAIISSLAKQKDDENWRFRSFLKACDKPDEEIDAIVQDLYRRISSEIDCQQCANCCKQLQPVLTQQDIADFSQNVELPVNEFKTKYLVKTETPGEFCFKMMPCPFLKNNLCTHYEHRPLDCKSFPHLHKPDFTFRLLNVIGNYSICPIVFNVYENLKSELWT
jgi:uncharacterized protein